MMVAKEEALFKAVKIDIMCGKLTALQREGFCSNKDGRLSVVLQDSSTSRTSILRPYNLLGCCGVVRLPKTSLGSTIDANDENGESHRKGFGRSLKGGTKPCIPSGRRSVKEGKCLHPPLDNAT